METAYNINRKAYVALPLLVVAVAVITSTGCARVYHAVHYNGVARTLHEEPRNYFHSGKTGRIIPKETCFCPVELPCYGYEPTCWRRWPEECVSCPVADEVINGEILIHQNDVIESGADAVYPPEINLEKTDANMSPDMSVGDTPDANGSARAKKTAPFPTQFELQQTGDYYRFASNPTQQATQSPNVEHVDSAGLKRPEIPESMPTLDSIVPQATKSDSGQNQKKPLTEKDASDVDWLTPAESSASEEIPSDTSDEWNSDNVGETMDTLIGSESPVPKRDSDMKNVSVSDNSATGFESVSFATAETEPAFVDSNSETSFMETALEPAADEEDNNSEGEHKTEPAANTSDKPFTRKLERTKDGEVSTFIHSALPNFAMPLPIHLLGKETKSESQSIREPNGSKANTDGESVNKNVTTKTPRKNTVRFRAETKSAEIIVPTEGSESSESTIQFKN